MRSGFDEPRHHRSVERILQQDSAVESLLTNARSKAALALQLNPAKGRLIADSPRVIRHPRARHHHQLAWEHSANRRMAGSDITASPSQLVARILAR
jgi:hypothetical protein